MGRRRRPHPSNDGLGGYITGLLIWLFRPWNVTAYGMPNGAGIATGMVWGHRGVLFPPVFFSSVFVIWTWYSASPDSCASFATQVRENAKVSRRTISYSLLELARRRWGIKMVMVLGALAVVYWGTYHWVDGGETRITMETPGATDDSSSLEPVIPTGRV